MTSVQHGEGITDSERYFQRLAKSSFLSIWCYGSVFHDQGRHCGKGDGKEVADLLVVFGDDILIFSDKFCQYGTTQDELISIPHWPSTFGDAFGPPVKAGGGADKIWPLLEDEAALELRIFEALNGSEVLVDQRGVGQRPEVLGGLQFGGSTGAEKQMHMVGHVQLDAGMPARAVKDGHDLFGLAPTWLVNSASSTSKRGMLTVVAR